LRREKRKGRKKRGGGGRAAPPFYFPFASLFRALFCCRGDEGEERKNKGEQPRRRKRKKEKGRRKRHDPVDHASADAFSFPICSLHRPFRLWGQQKEEKKEKRSSLGVRYLAVSDRVISKATRIGVPWGRGEKGKEENPYGGGRKKKKKGEKGMNEKVGSG